MRRWHQERNLARREWKQHRLIHVEFNLSRGIGDGPSQRSPGSDLRAVECACDEQMGRFRKKRAYDCGTPRCRLCHGDKFPRRRPGRQETVAGLRFTEQLQELAPEDS
jgi:hypothetical protein